MKRKLKTKIMLFLLGALSALSSIAGIIICFILAKVDNEINMITVAILLPLSIGLLFFGVYLIICAFTEGDNNARKR